MIRLLDQQTINQIAAGEVIERPAAVVKELVENAIDAMANAITVEIKEGGISFIRITDNGMGISKDQLPTAFLRHATSKITSAQDLLSVSSLGFRGEALSSVSSVAQVECISKTKDSITGCQYEINGGKAETLKEIGCPNGTTFIIRNLFYNTPARRKFLKSAKTESSYIVDLMERFALSHSNISFKFIMDQKIRLQTSGNGDCRNNIYYIYGSDITKSLVAVEQDFSNMKLSGFVAKPEVSRGTRAYMNYFINGRYIKSPLIQRAIEDVYKKYTMAHRYPFTTLFFLLPSENIDVNVHPTKMEVRFSNPDEVYQLVFNGIQEALNQISMIPKVQLKEPVVPEKVEFEYPDLSQSIKPNTEINKKIQSPEPFEQVRREITPPPLVKEMPVYEYKQADIFSGPLDDDISKEPPSFRMIGQVFSTYWLIQYQEEFLIIDQHAAHEKVLYEKFMKAILEDQILSQNLVVPIIVTLSSREEEVLQDNLSVLNQLGFQVEPFGGKEYAISAVPSDFLDFAGSDLFFDLITNLTHEGLHKDSSSKMILEKCASMACKAAVKGNHTLTLMEATQLVEDMLLLENPYHCPHGRPTTIAMTKRELEKKFKRIL